MRHAHALKTKQPSLGLVSFLVGLGAALLLFLPFILYDKGFFIYYGDFNSQEIAFYKLAHESVRSGNIFWSWNTDLGANFIGSYAFYMIGSPFFWLTLPFPTSWVPYLMGPLLMLKFACATAAAYAYLSRFVSPQLSVMGGLLYAFSGFSLYNVFFNHFHEAIVFFPLMLLGMELYMKEGRRGLFAVTVCLSALANYYFFAGQCVFLILYWFVRCLSGEWKCSFGKFLGIFFEALAGTLMAAVILLPAFLATIQNPRTENLIAGWNALFYSGQRTLDILHAFFFPQDMPATACFFPNAGDKWTSTSAWLPVFGCTGVIAYLQSRKHKDWLHRMLILCGFFVFVPLLNALFQFGIATYYSRWFYMLTLLMVLATALCFEEADTHPVGWKRAYGWSVGITAAFTVVIGFLPRSLSKVKIFGLYERGTVLTFWTTVGIAATALIVGGLLTALFRADRHTFAKSIIPMTAVCCLLFGWYTLGSGKAIGQYSGDFMRQYALCAESPLTLPESDTIERIDTYLSLDNQGIFWGYPSINAFHTIVPGSVMEFYPTIGIERDVATRPDKYHNALRAFTSVRWLTDYSKDNPAVDKSASRFFENAEGETAMDGWTRRWEKNGVVVYENDNYVPLGFTYDRYITRSAYDALEPEEREFALLKAMVIDDADAPLYKGLLSELDLSTVDFTYEAFTADCAARAAVTCSSVRADNRGFTATISTRKMSVVFFSVPYEDGWSLTVNGKAGRIYKAGVGFMAVVVPAGVDTEIRFSYMTPGLRVGLIVSGGALAAFLLYLLITGLVSRHRRRAVDELLEGKIPVEPVMQPRSEGTFDLYTVYHGEEETPHE